MRLQAKLDRDRVRRPPALARLADMRRRVSGPLDRSVFRTQRLRLPYPRHSYELTPLSLYRLGLAGTYGKYRIVPRSAIVGYDELCNTVRAHRADDELTALIARLWQRHGAPSPGVVDAFLRAAAELDRRGPDSDARDRLLEAWLAACAPRSAAGRIRDDAELALCFVLRRARQYAYAVRHRWAPGAHD